MTDQMDLAYKVNEGTGDCKQHIHDTEKYGD